MARIANKKAALGAILVLIAGCTWGTSGIFLHYMVDYGMSSMQMAYFKVFASMIVIGLYILVTNPRRFIMTRRGYLVALGQGVLSQTIFNVVHFNGIQYLGMASEAVMLYTAPIYVTIFSRILFKEPITRRKCIAMIIVLIGCAFASTGGVFDAARISVFGLCMGVCAGFCNGMNSITARLGTETDDPLSLTFYTMVFGYAGLVIAGKPWTFTGINWDSQLVIIIAACAIVSSSIPYGTFAKGISMLPETSMGPILSSVEVVATAIYGYVLFGEVVGVVKIVGIILVLAAIVMINKPEHRRE